VCYYCNLRPEINMVTITRVNSVEGLGLWNLKSWLSFISPERGYLVKMLLVYKYLIIKSFPTSHHIFVICRIMVLYRTVQLYRMHATDKLQVSTQISFISTCTQSRIILLASTGFKLRPLKLCGPKKRLTSSCGNVTKIFHESIIFKTEAGQLEGGSVWGVPIISLD
jgi:hypothetical protein